MPRSQRHTSTSSRSDKRQSRGAYSLTCSNCRARKIKCDSGQPECQICLAYGERCHYDKPPPMSQVLAMATRIKDLEGMLEHQKSDSKEQAAVSTRPSENPIATTQQLTPNSIECAGDRSNALPETDKQAAERDDSSHYPSTSAIEEPMTTGMRRYAEVNPPREPSWSESFTAITPSQLEFWEAEAVATGANLLRLEPSVVAHLLQTHWIWVNPTPMFVARPYFLRDAATGGPYFSELLLCVICLHSTRFTKRAFTDELLSRARLLLGRALHAEPTLTTIQALLQFSAREVGQGESSTAWLYSGMAFRMVTGMNLFSACKSLGRNPLETRLRRHVAWAAYNYDKQMSLYLGREPVMHNPPEYEPTVVEESAELKMWPPSYHDSSETQALSQVPSHAVSCFGNLCRLTVIVSDVLLTMYNRKLPEGIHSFVTDIDQRLGAWRSETPPHLVIDDPHSATLCPLPHILGQNLLFHTTRILLHRPFRRSAYSRETCRTAGEQIARLLSLLDKHFGLSRVTYLMAYSAYTAATVAMLDMWHGVDGSQQRVNTYLRILYAVRSSCPSIQRSIDIIIRDIGKSITAIPSAPPAADDGATFLDCNELGQLPPYLFDPTTEFLSFGLPDVQPQPFGDGDGFSEGFFDVGGNALDAFGVDFESMQPHI